MPVRDEFICSGGHAFDVWRPIRQEPEVVAACPECGAPATRTMQVGNVIVKRAKPNDHSAGDLTGQPIRKVI